MNFDTLLEQGDKVGDYTILTTIKPGSNNSVYKAYIENEGKKFYAIKAYPYENDEQVEAVETELNILETFGQNDSIVCFKDCIIQEIRAIVTDEKGESTERNVKFIFVVMDFYDQLDLNDFFLAHRKTKDGRKSLEIELIRQIFYKTLKILADVHKNNVVHHDIKPHNFLVKSINPLKIALADFELAVQLIPNETIKYKAGTYKYMAPEILEDKPHNNSVDIWSLGVMMYYFAFGRYPCLIGNNDDPNVILRKIRNYSNSISYGHKFTEPFLKFVDLLKKFLKYEPKDRTTAEEALKDKFFEDYIDLENETKQVAEGISEIVEQEIQTANNYKATQVLGYVPKEKKEDNEKEDKEKE